MNKFKERIFETIDTYIPHDFKPLDLSKWNNDFIPLDNVEANSALLLAGIDKFGSNCVGFVAEYGTEFLLCKAPNKHPNCWVSIRNSLFEKLDEVDLFCKWLKRKGCLKTTR